MPRNRLDTKDRLVSQLRDRFTETFNFLSGKYHEEWLRLRRHYNGKYAEAMKKKGSYNVWISKGFSFAETDTAASMLRWFSSDKLFDLVLKPKWRGLVPVEFEQMAENGLNDELKQAMIFYAMCNLLKATNIDGTGGIIASYSEITQKAKRRQPIIVGGQFVGFSAPKEVEEVVYRGISQDVVEAFNIYPWPVTAANEEKAVHVAVEDYITEEDYKAERDQGNYEGFEDDEIGLLKGDESVYKNFQIAKLENLGYPVPQTMQSQIRRQTFFFNDRTVVMLAGQFIVKDKENKIGVKPFTRAVKYYEPNSFWAMSGIKPGERLALAMNTLLNQYLNHGAYANNPVMYYRSGIPETLFKNEPGAKVPLPNPQTDVNWQQVPPLGADPWRLIELINQYYDDGSGQSDLQRGQISGPLQATIGALAVQKGDMRNRFNSMVFEEWTMKPHVDKCRRILAEALPNESFSVRLERDKFDNVDKRIYFPDYEVVVRGTGASAEMISKRETFVKLFGLMAALPFIDQRDFVKRIFDMFEIQNAEELIKDENDIAELLGAMQGQVQPTQTTNGRTPKGMPTSTPQLMNRVNKRIGMG